MDAQQHWGWELVVSNSGRFALDNQKAETYLAQMRKDSVDLVIGSPPYALKASRYEGVQTFPNTPRGWAQQMAFLTLDACSVSRGYVMWVVDSPRDKKTHEYHAAAEMMQVLITEQFDSSVFRLTPMIWTKNGAPGGKYYPGHCWEYVLVYCGAGKTPAYNPEAIGDKSKYKGSGGGRQRLPNGVRNGPSKGWRNKGGPSRPRDTLRFTVGGGHMGRKILKDGRLVTDMVDDNLCSSGGEAPFPWTLGDYLIRGFSDPDAIVCDPFVGTGTSALAALMNGRRFVGNDIRENQLELTRKRVSRIEGFSDAV